MSLPEVYRQYTAFSLMRLFDLTQLTEDTPSSTTLESSSLACENGPPAASCVCVLPSNVKRVKWALHSQQQQQLQQEPGMQRQQVAAALNYPYGNKSIDEVCMEAASALKDGADEFECLIDWKAMNENVLEGEKRLRLLVSEIKRVVAPRPLRAVLEVGKLSGGDIISRAAIAALEGGADFLQTSSGLEADQATFFSVHLLSVAIDAYGKKAAIAAEQIPSLRDPKKVGVKVDIGPRGTQLEATNYLMQMVHERGMDFIQPATFRIGGSETLLNELKSVVASYAPPDSAK